jgi:transcriptional regulator with XRE-family HTH domain
MTSFGQYLRQLRETRHAAAQAADVGRYTLRSVAANAGLEPSYLSKIERDIQPPPSEAKVRALAEALGEDADVLLALAGKVSGDLLEAIRKRPQLFAHIIRELKDMPDHAVLRIVREVRDGQW